MKNRLILLSLIVLSLSSFQEKAYSSPRLPSGPVMPQDLYALVRSCMHDGIRYQGINALRRRLTAHIDRRASLRDQGVVVFIIGDQMRSDPEMTEIQKILNDKKLPVSFASFSNSTAAASSLWILGVELRGALDVDRFLRLDIWKKFGRQLRFGYHTIQSDGLITLPANYGWMDGQLRGTEHQYVLFGPAPQTREAIKNWDNWSKRIQTEPELRNLRIVSAQKGQRILFDVSNIDKSQISVVTDKILKQDAKAWIVNLSKISDRSLLQRILHSDPIYKVGLVVELEDNLEAYGRASKWPVAYRRLFEQVESNSFKIDRVDGSHVRLSFNGFTEVEYVETLLKILSLSDLVVSVAEASVVIGGE